MCTIRTRLTVGIVSAVSVAMELLLMRVLAVRFWQHFSYLIISTAMLGLGASGTALSLLRGLVKRRRAGVLAGLAVALALAIPLSLRLAELVPLNVRFFTRDLLGQGGWFVLIELIFALPMFLGGAAIGVSLMDEPRCVSGHYAASLVGSGVGAAGVVALLSIATPAETAVVLAVAAYVAGLILLPWRWYAAVGAAAAGVVFVVGQVLAPWQPSMSQYKDLAQLQRMPDTRTIHREWGPLGRIDVVAGEAVHYVPPGFSLAAGLEAPAHVLLLADGDAAGAVFDVRSRDGFAFLDDTTWALPYRLARVRSVLVLGAGGGGDVGLARYHSAERVVAVEPNPQIVAAMAGPLRDAGGAIYELEGVELARGGARGYLAGGGADFDLIQLPFVDVSPAGERAARVAYLYTVEAFEWMGRRLRAGGMINLACEAGTPPAGGLRMLATAAEALRRTGRSPDRHLIMIRALGTVNLTILESPVTDDQAAAVRSFCRDRGFDLCHLPGLRAAETNVYHRLEEGYFAPARRILGADREAFFDEYILDVRATYDNRPFFFHFVGLNASKELAARIGSMAWNYVEIGYVLLLAALAQSVLLAAALILLPLAGRAGKLRRTPGKKRALVYFLLVGLGFMFLEMKFLHHLTLYLADPIYSAAVVIGAFLVFAGVGSRLSERWGGGDRQIIRWAGLSVVAMVGAHVVFLPGLLAWTAGWSAPARVGVAVAVIAPLAVAMGHMFPAAIRRLGVKAGAIVPWCWAVNGFASVIAAVGATLLAVEAGFAVVAAVGAGAYVLAAVVRVE